jgi:hypothetical protein
VHDAGIGSNCVPPEGSFSVFIQRGWRPMFGWSSALPGGSFGSRTGTARAALLARLTLSVWMGEAESARSTLQRAGVPCVCDRMTFSGPSGSERHA